ncbi:hypothetical protein TNCV_891141 [Trichonephila clavipes]|nr:hypothetical protein TNCV_891141 [Trichonephila clavipes]
MVLPTATTEGRAAVIPKCPGGSPVERDRRNIYPGFMDCHGWLGCSPIWTSIFDDFFRHLWPYVGNNTANVVFQMVKRLWLIRIDP